MNDLGKKMFNRMNMKIGILLIIGVMLTAGLIAGFNGYVFAADPVPGLNIIIEQIPGGSISTKNYNSSLSNKFTTAKINEEVGNILIRYSISGAVINEVTEALSGGVYEAELKSFLVEIGIGDEGVNEVFAKLDELGAGFIKSDDQEKSISTSGAGDTVRAVVKIEIAVEKIERGGASVSGTYDMRVGSQDVSGLESEVKTITIKEGDGTVARRKPTYANITLERAVFRDSAISSIRNMKAVAPEERDSLKKELKVSRQVFREDVQVLRQNILERAKNIRESFRDDAVNMITVRSGVPPKLCEAVCKGRIAIAHGKGLRMFNRFDSAITRFGHILGRIESRIEKLKARDYRVDSFFDVETSIEEAKNIQVVSEAKLEELKEKYESLLGGENLQGIGEEAREIAEGLKGEIQILHAKLREIVDEIKLIMASFNSSRSNKSSN